MVFIRRCFRPAYTGTQAEEHNLKLRPSLWMKNQCTPTKPSARLCLNRKISASVDVSEKSMLDQSVSSQPPEVCPASRGTQKHYSEWHTMRTAQGRSTAHRHFYANSYPVLHE